MVVYLIVSDRDGSILILSYWDGSISYHELLGW